MLPQIRTIHTVNDLAIWQTKCGRVGCGFELTPVDLESNDVLEYSNRLSAFIKHLSPDILARVHFESFYSKKSTDTDFISDSRSRAVSELGHRKNKFFFYVNHTGCQINLESIKNAFVLKTDFSVELQSLIKLKDAIINFGFQIKPLDISSIQKLFDFKYDLIKTTKSLESEIESIGIIRMVKQSNSEIDQSSLYNVLSKIKDFRITVSFQKISDVKSKLILEKKLKQLKSQTDVTSFVQVLETEESIKNQFSLGTSFVEFEFLVIFHRTTQSELVNDMAQALTELNKFADFKIETYGLAESFISSHPACTQHVTLTETDQAMPLHLPLFVKNDTDVLSEERSLTLFREDRTLSYFDLFNSKYNCFNTLIIGSSGKGKSVLTGLLTKSLLCINLFNSK